jgi:hypothetical protein
VIIRLLPALALLLLSAKAVALDVSSTVSATLDAVGAVIAVKRPTQVDVNAIAEIAKLGASERVTFHKGSDVAAFIADKCGRPSDLISVHPTYLKSFLDANSGVNTTDLASLPSDMTLTIPACARFADPPGDVPSGKGLGVLAKDLSIPFNSDLFEAIANNAVKRKRAQDEGVEIVNSGGIAQVQQTSLDTESSGRHSQVSATPSGLGAALLQVCDKQGSSTDVVTFFACINALDAVISNTNIKSTTKIPGTVKLSAPVATDTPFSSVDWVSLKPNTRDEITPALGAAGDPQSPLRFVTDVNEGAYKYSCSHAEVIRKGDWPIDTEQLLTVFSMTDMFGATLAKTHVLIVDSGFDFTWDHQQGLPLVKLVFPKQYFFAAKSDPYDRNNPLPKETEGWMGINISANKIAPYATTSVVDPFRWHGLAVTTLIIGGRDLERWRHAIQFPFAVTEANLVPLNRRNYVINPGHLDRALALAGTPTNNFQIVNLSLATNQRLSSLEKPQLKGVVVVTAAGNDTQQVDPNKVTWPAALGGKPRFDEVDHTVFITVGAHDAEGRLAEFSNYGMAIDLLAPGCRVPSYKLSNDQDPKPNTGFVTGTSFAAPLVSFTAALLDSLDGFHGRPGAIKTRIITSTDFKSDLLEKAYSSGILNIPKALASKFDVLQAEGEPRFSLGSVNSPVGSIKCEHKTIDFKNVLKLSKDVTSQIVLLFETTDLADPTAIQRHVCDISELPEDKMIFADDESGDEREVSFRKVIDYVRHN